MRLRKKKLRSAAAEVREAILAQYMPDNEDTTFSKKFEQKIVVINEMAQRRERFIQIRRSVIAIILIATLCGSVFVTTSPVARAAVREWIREIYEHSIVFHFTASSKSSELPFYSPTWLPDGMELVETTEMSSQHGEYYMDANGNDLSIDYVFADDSSVILYDNLDGSTIQWEEITIHGNVAYYIPPDEYGQSCIMWTEDGIAFTIDGTLEKQDMLHISESLVIVKTDK